MLNAASHLLALVIVIMAPTFTLALWMPLLLLFKDGAAGAGVFNGAGAGSGVVAIVGVFIDNAAGGADCLANADRAVAVAVTRHDKNVGDGNAQAMVVCGGVRL